MTKSELKTGMIVKYRDGSIRMVLRNILHSVDAYTDVLVGPHGWITLNSYSNELINIDPYSSSLDIVDVYRTLGVANYASLLEGNHILNDDFIDTCCTLIWKRPEPVVEMTIKEIEEKLGIQNLKIIEEQ